MADAQAPPQTLTVAGLQLSVGMSKEQVDQLLKQANLTTAQFQGLKPPYEEWAVCAQGQTNTGSCDIVGEITFASGRASMLVARWGPAARSVSEAGMALYGAMQDMKKRGFRTCDFNARDSSDQEHAYKQVLFNCGRFTYISVSVSKTLGGSSTLSIDEIVSDHEQSSPRRTAL